MSEMTSEQEAPPSIARWRKDNPIKDKMSWRGGAEYQYDFFQEVIPALLDVDAEAVQVASTHTSKSIKLPVVHFNLHGAKITMRHNFHDVKVSVDSPAALTLPGGRTAEFLSYLHYDKEGNEVEDTYLHSVYFEGFKPEWIFTGYKPGENDKQFSVCLMNLAHATAFLLVLQDVLRRTM